MTLKRLTWWDEFRVADDSTDIRGWKALDGGGIEVGTVADLLFDPEEGRVRYVSLDLDDHAAGIGERRDGRNVLVPIGTVDLDAERRRIVLRELAAAALADLPAYDGAAELDQAREQELYRAYHPAWSPGGAFDYTSARYRSEHPRFEALERRFAAVMSNPRPATFTAAEPDLAERAARRRARDTSGDWPA